MVVLVKVVPFMLYSYSAPSGEVITTVPVGTAQVGCAMVTSATPGVPGEVMIVTPFCEVQVMSVVLLTVTV